MFKCKIRFNTICSDNLLFWRLIVNDKEYLCSHIDVFVPLKTTKDIVFDSQRNELVEKWHLSCDANNISWNGTQVVVS